MKRLLIGLLLVAILASGCTAQKVYKVAPLPTATTTTAALTWNDVANLPVGTVVELTGYCTLREMQGNKYTGYQLSQVSHPDNYAGQPIRFISYNIHTTNPPIEGSYIKVQVRIETPNFQELSRTTIN
jgi:hypothetical protein